MWVKYPAPAQQRLLEFRRVFGEKQQRFLLINMHFPWCTQSFCLDVLTQPRTSFRIIVWPYFNWCISRCLRSAKTLTITDARTSQKNIHSTHCQGTHHIKLFRKNTFAISHYSVCVCIYIYITGVFCWQGMALIFVFWRGTKIRLHPQETFLYSRWHPWDHTTTFT